MLKQPVWLALAMALWMPGCATYSIIAVEGVKVSDEITRLDPATAVPEKQLAKLYVNRKELALAAVDGRRLDPNLTLGSTWYGLSPGEHALQVKYQFAQNDTRLEMDPVTFTARFTEGRRYLLVSELASLQASSPTMAFPLKRYEVKDITRVDDLVELIEKEESYITRSVFLSVLYSVAPKNSTYYYLGQTSQIKDEKLTLEILDKVIQAKANIVE